MGIVLVLLFLFPCEDTCVGVPFFLGLGSRSMEVMPRIGMSVLFHIRLCPFAMVAPSLCALKGWTLFGMTAALPDVFSPSVPLSDIALVSDESSLR